MRAMCFDQAMDRGNFIGAGPRREVLLNSHAETFAVFEGGRAVPLG